jgi:signal transduction histidine kinase
MTNAIRHGRASRIQISFWISDGRLRISVDDNGIGSTDIEPGIGFTGMRERLDPLGGELTLGNGLTGFTVRAEIPWPGE